MNKGMSTGLKFIIVLAFVIIIIAAVVPDIVSGMENAGQAAKSCPAWMSTVRDISGLKYICGG